MLLFMIVLGLTGCGGDRSDKEGSGKTELTIHSVAKKELPKEVKSKMDELTDSKKEGEATVRKGDRIYLLVALGERSTGGYSVDFTKAELADGKLHVYAKEKTPSKDSAVTQAITYPVEVGYVETDSAENIKEYQFHVEKDSKGDKDRSKGKTELTIHSVSKNELPMEAKTKMDELNNTKKEGNAILRKGNRIYLFVALGERSTGGYSVDFTKAELEDGTKLHVYAKERTASKDSAVTLAITYPVGVGYVEIDLPESIKEYQFHVEKAPKKVTPKDDADPIKEKGSGKTELKIHSVSNQDLPSEVKSRADELRNARKEGNATLRKGNRIYVFVALGERRTGGYSIDFTKAELVNGTQLHIYAKEVSPSKGSIVTQAFTYPVGVGYIEIDSPGSIKEYRFHVN